MLKVLIMAGGKGTRFWPVSTESKPKQYTKIMLTLNYHNMMQ